MGSQFRAVVVNDDALPLFLTVEEAAEVLGVSRASAYEYIARELIPAVRFGRRLRVPRAALLELGHSPAAAPFELREGGDAA
jgi:excisionase family DNA binding protein